MDSVPMAFWIGLGAAISFLVLPFLGYGLIALVEHFKGSEEDEAKDEEETAEAGKTMSNFALDKEDMMNLVCSQSVPYELIGEYEKKGYGHYTGGFCDKWDWNTSKLEELEKEELFQIYRFLKEYWRDGEKA